MIGKIIGGQRHEVVDLESAEPIVFSPPCRALMLGVGGVLNIQGVDMDAPAVTAEVPAGLFIYECAVLDPDGTTAEEITAIW